MMISSMLNLISLCLLSITTVHAQEPDPIPDNTEELPPLVKMPTLLEYIQAPYPELAKQEEREGVVLLLIEIDEAGDVSYIEVLQSAGEDFDTAATEAAWKFVFSPAEDENGPTPVQIEFEYGFVLDASSVEGAVEDAQSKEEIQGTINLDGLVIEMGTKRPLANFPVIAELPDGTMLETTTTTDGRYEFAIPMLGSVTLRSSYPEYQTYTKTVDILENEKTTVRVWMKNLNYREDELVAVYRKPSADVSRRTLSVEEVKRVPGTFGDPIRVIQNLPGAARSPFGSGLLIIRGSNPQDSGVYVDGIRIPLIYHLGGLVSIFNSDMIDSVDYLPGSYGVQYGRSLGGVVDVKTKDLSPEDNQVFWSTDIIDSGGLVQGKVGNWGVAVAGRRSYIDLFIPAFTKDTAYTVSPKWFDYQVKLQHLDQKNGELSVFFFGFKDDLKVATDAGTAQGTDQDFQGNIRNAYSTHRAYLKWTHNFSDSLQSVVIPSFGVDKNLVNLGGGIQLDQSQPMLELRSELRWKQSEHLQLTLGTDSIVGWFDFTAKLPFTFAESANYDPLAERTPVSFGGNGYFVTPDLYLQSEIHPLRDPKKWTIYPGIRFGAGGVYGAENPDPLVQIKGADPRISSRFMLTENSTLKGGIGLYSQWPQPFQAWRPTGGTDLGLEKVVSAEMGVEQNIAPGVSADISVFGKHLYNLIVNSPDASDVSDLFYVNEGIGRVYGMETIIKHAPVNNFFGWVSYTLSRSERNNYPNRTSELSPDEVENSPSSGGWYLFNLDQTHILVMVAGYQLPKNFNISSQLQYVSGNPYTPYSGGINDLDQNNFIGYSTAPYNSSRLPPYFSVNARLDKTLTFEQWQLELYTDLLNIVRGQNPEFVAYNYDFTDYRFVRGLPFIPSVGFNADFHF